MTESMQFTRFPVTATATKNARNRISAKQKINYTSVKHNTSVMLVTLERNNTPKTMMKFAPLYAHT